MPSPHNLPSPSSKVSIRMSQFHQLNHSNCDDKNKTTPFPLKKKPQTLENSQNYSSPLRRDLKAFQRLPTGV